MNERLEQFTNTRMLSSLAASATKPFDVSVEELFAAVHDWCTPKGPRDDISILGLSIVQSA